MKRWRKSIAAGAMRAIAFALAACSSGNEQIADGEPLSYDEFTPAVGIMAEYTLRNKDTANYTVVSKHFMKRYEKYTTQDDAQKQENFDRYLKIMEKRKTNGVYFTENNQEEISEVVSSSRTSIYAYEATDILKNCAEKLDAHAEQLGMSRDTYFANVYKKVVFADYADQQLQNWYIQNVYEGKNYYAITSDEYETMKKEKGEEQADAEITAGLEDVDAQYEAWLLS